MKLIEISKVNSNEPRKNVKQQFNNNRLFGFGNNFFDYIKIKHKKYY